MNNKQDEQTIKFGIECVRARMSNSIARCYFAHHHDEDHEGRMTCYFSGTIETGEFGFWVGLDGDATPDHTVGSGELPTAKIVDPCQAADETVKALADRIGWELDAFGVMFFSVIVHVGGVPTEKLDDIYVVQPMEAK